MIVYQHRIYRLDLWNNREVLYVFGDNLLRRGYGGQAKQMRGEPNAVGIATKKTPGSDDGDFFSDEQYAKNRRWIFQDYEPVKKHLEEDGIVIVPSDGIGTGLSEMPSRCPRTFSLIQSLGLGGAPNR